VSKGVVHLFCPLLFGQLPDLLGRGYLLGKALIKGKGERILEEGAKPPLKHPLPGLFRGGIKRGFAPLKLPC
jgi:hypothetical protein